MNINKEKQLINSIYASEKNNEGLLYRLFDTEEGFFDYILNLDTYEELEGFYKSAMNLNIGSKSVAYVGSLLEKIRKYNSLGNLSQNFYKMDELIKKQLGLFEDNGEISKKNLRRFEELDNEIDKVSEKFSKGLDHLELAKDKSSGKIEKAFNCKYSIAAIQVGGKKMSWSRFFENYLPL